MTQPSPIHFERRGLLFVLSAPSGCGKSVVLRRLLTQTPELSYSVSVTSRAPRPGEVNGRDYQFVSRGEFQAMIERRSFYEWAEVHGNLYGTRVSTVDAALDQGRDVVLDIDVQGGLAVKHRSPLAVLVFLLPPSGEVLEQRLRGRGTETEAQIALRLKNAREEMRRWHDYDYAVVNDDLDETVEAVRQILEAERRRVSRLRLSDAVLSD